MSCTQRGIVGTKDELEVEFARVQTHGLAGLIMSHCPKLSMPARIRSSVKMIKIHNCTLVEWGPEAALTATSHPTMRSLYITMINLSGIPDGLLASDFPPTLYDIQLSDTNLTELPVDIFEKTWREVVAFVFERSSGITEVPRALLYPEASTWVLSLTGNAIQMLPEDFFTLRRYYHVYLDRNAIQVVAENARTSGLAVDWV